jgi:integrase
LAERGVGTAATRALAHVGRFLKWCAARDLIDVNPAASIEARGAPASRDRVLDDQELVEVWGGLEGMVEPFQAGMRLLVLTAARRSEIFEARKVEMLPDAIRLPKERAKNEEGRLIHLAPAAKAIVEKLTVWPDCACLLTTDGEHAFSGFSKAKVELDRRILAARKKVLGVDATPMPEWRLHDLRRSVATGLQRLGVRLEVIEAALGHIGGSRAGIVGVYQKHRFAAEAAEALALWGEHIGRLLDPTPAKVVPMQRVK